MLGRLTQSVKRAAHGTAAYGTCSLSLSRCVSVCIGDRLIVLVEHCSSRSSHELQPLGVRSNDTGSATTFTDPRVPASVRHFATQGLTQAVNLHERQRRRR